MVSWFGADWDSKKCVVAFEVDGKLHRKEVVRRPDAVRAFVNAFGKEGAVVGIESGDQLWVGLWRAAGVTVHIFDGKKSRRFSESLCSSGARDDRRAAEDLLAMVRSDAHRRDANQETPKAVRSQLRLYRLTDETARDVVRHENRLYALVNQVHPALLLVAARSLKTAWMQRLLDAAPTPARWKALDANERDAALKGSCKAKRACLRQAMADAWIEYDDNELAAIAVQMRARVQALREAIARDRAARKALGEAVATHADAQILTAVNGIGDSLAAAIIIGAAGADASRDGISLALGAAPVTTRSGKKGDARPGVHMRRAAPASMRKAAYQIGWQLTGNHRWARAQYAACRAKGHSAAAAYRRITRSFARIVTALIRDGVAFDEERYIQQLKNKGVSWAMTL